MLFTDNMYEIIHMHNTFAVYFPNFPLASLIDLLRSPSICVNSPFFTYLEIPLLVIVVQMSIHSRPW